MHESMENLLVLSRKFRVKMQPLRHSLEPWCEGSVQQPAVGPTGPSTHRLSVNSLRWLPVAIQAAVHVGGVLPVEPEDKRGGGVVRS